MECFSKLLLLYTVYGQRHGRTSRLQTASKQPPLHPTQLKWAPHLSVCVSVSTCVRQKEVGKKACVYFYKTKHGTHDCIVCNLA